MLLAAPIAPALARQSGPSVSELKELIARMEKVDQDPATPPEVKILNRRFLEERRRQLRSSVTSSVESLRKYRAEMAARLTPQELQAIDDEIEKGAREAGTPPSVPSESAAGAGGERPARGFTGMASASADGRTPPPLPRAPVSAPAASPAPAAAAPQGDCYADAPPILVDVASAAAFRVVRDGGDAIDQSLPRLLFFTLADAVSRGELDSARSGLIRSIRVQQFMEETARTDKQTGASARSEGSTSAVERPNFVNLLSFAVEHGAIQKEVSGTSLTLSSSPYALVAAASGDTAETYKKYDFFHRIGISANFNIDDEDNVLASARRKQLSEWSVRARLSKDRSTRSAEFEEFWNREVRSTFERVPLVLVTEFSDLFRDQTEKVRRQVGARFRQQAAEYLIRNQAITDEAAKRAGLQQAILCQLKQEVFNDINSFGLTADDRQRIVSRTLPALRDAVAGERSALARVKQKIEEMNNRPLATFAYTNKREAAGSDYSTLKFLYERKTFSPMKLVANAGLSLYHKPDGSLNQQTTRDLALALSLEGKAGRSPFVSAELDQSQITFAFTGRYQRMFENRGIAGRKADLAFAQFRLEVPFMSGLSLPFSVTYANATELVKEDHVRANFGFSFDADKLFLIRNFFRGTGIE